VGPYLVGLVVVDPERFGPARLEAVPGDVLVRDPEFTQLISTTGKLAMSSARPRQRYEVTPDLSFVLRPPFRPIPGGFDLTRAPAELLVAEHGIVPFLGREAELDELTVWCENNKPFSVRVLAGRGGTGKSRLAGELSARLLANGWAAGFADLHSPGGEIDNEMEDPTLVVVDDAEGAVSVVAELVAQLAWQGSSSPIRILLVTRQVGSWYEQVREQAPELMGYEADPLSLDASPVPEGERALHYEAATRAFSTHLGAPARRSELPWPLSRAEFGLPLLIHMSALLAAGGDAKTTTPDERLQAQVVGQVLRRERRRWSDALRARGLADLDPEVANSAVAVATLAGADNEEEAVELLASVRDLTDKERRGKVARWLHELYPGELYLNPLAPDLLAEHMLGETPQLGELAVAVVDTDRAATRRITRLLNRLYPAAERHSEVLAALSVLLARRVPQLVGVAMASEGERLADPLNLALELIRQRNNALLIEDIAGTESVLDELPGRNDRLASLAENLALVAVADLRQRAPDGEATLGRMLAQLAQRHWDVGRREDALETARAAVPMLTPSQGKTPQDTEPQDIERRARALTKIALVLMWTDNWTEAAHPLREVVAIYDHFGDEIPDADRLRAGALMNEGVALSALGDPRAIDVTRDAVGIFSTIGARYEEVSATVNLAIRLREFERHPEDLAALSHAVDLSRTVAADGEPDHLNQLGFALGNLSTMLVDYGRLDGAIDARLESVDHIRTAFSIEPDLYGEPLAGGLGKAAALLYQIGRTEEASEAMEEAVTVARELSEINPRKYMKNLPVGLRNLAQLRELTGDSRGGRRLIQEADEIERRHV
jgi:tetratricopeptide (TPR) repeat protein